MGAERTLKKVLMIVLAIFVAAAVLVFVLTHLFRGEPRTLELGSFETAATLHINSVVFGILLHTELCCVCPSVI